MKDTVSILKIAYPNVENAMKKNLSKYKQFISKFINDRSDLLYSNMPSKQIYFSQTDCDEFFRMSGIDESVIKTAIQGTYYYDIANFNPSYAKDETTIAMLCAVRYFKLKNMKKELDLALILLSFSGKFYPSVWYGSYPTNPPYEHIMEYVVTHMCTNKYDIVREGSVIGAVKSIALTWVNSYDSRFKDFHDDDVTYLVQQLRNRIKSFMINIAELYYEAYKNKDMYITYDSDSVSEDDFHLADSDAFKIERIVSSTITYINSHGVDYRICKMASNNLIKLDELKSILEMLLTNNANIPLIKEYVTLLVACFYRENPKSDVRDIEFVSYSIKPKPNSKDKYVIRQKEILDIILINNSEHFARRRSREATESAYYRSINAYFALIIQQAMK
jgi:hypothetical protein